MTMSIATNDTKPAGQRMVAVSFVIATLFTSGVTMCTGLYSADRQAVRNERVAQVNRFIDSTQKFDPLVAQLVAEVRVSAVKPATRAAVKANLLEQRSLADSASGLLTAEDRLLAEQYMDTLARADDGLERATGPLDFQPFAQAAADIAGQRTTLVASLRSGAGLPSDAKNR